MILYLDTGFPLFVYRGRPCHKWVAGLESTIEGQRLLTSIPKEPRIRGRHRYGVMFDDASFFG